MIVLSQTFIVAATSTLLLSLLSSATVYVYTEYARPETTDPKAYEEALLKKLNNINHVLKDLDKFKIKVSPDKFVHSGTTNKKLLTSLVKGNAIMTCPDDPVKILFKSISSYITSSKVAVEDQKNLKDESKNVIEKILFPSELGKYKTLIHELPTDFSDPSSLISNELVISQVGLSLRTPKIFASVYKIQNVFNTPGKVGHLFVIKGFKDLGTSFKFDLSKFNLLNKTPEPAKTFTFNHSDMFNVQVVASNAHLAETLANSAMFEEKPGNAPYLNPYKWLNTALLLNKLFNPSDLVYVLLTPKNYENNPDYYKIGINYPGDVETIPADLIQGEKIDSVLHTGDASRILNHCKDYLPRITLAII